MQVDMACRLSIVDCEKDEEVEKFNGACLCAESLIKLIRQKSVSAAQSEPSHRFPSVNESVPPSTCLRRRASVGTTTIPPAKHGNPLPHHPGHSTPDPTLKV